jgi:hypothetical protein
LVDLGTCRKTDLFITNERLQEIEDFQFLRFDFCDDDEAINLMRDLNDGVEKPIAKIELPPVEEEVDNSIERIEEEEKRAKGMFGDLLL